MGDPARCLDCGYVLTGLEGYRCPECGREFYLGDPTSYLRWVFTPILHRVRNEFLVYQLWKERNRP